MHCVETILAAVERLPGARVEIDDAVRSAEVRVGARLVARIDLHRGRVVVNAPADVVPSSRPTRNRIIFDVADSSSCSDALAAIRRRVRVERLVWQFRGASP